MFPLDSVLRKSTFKVSTVVGLLIVLSSGLLILVSLSWYQFIERRERLDDIVQTYVGSYSKQIDSIIELNEEKLVSYVYDYSWWDEMVEFVDEPSGEQWDIIGEGTLDIFDVDGIWVIDRQGKEVWGINEVLPEGEHFHFPHEPHELARAFKDTPYPVFFIRDGENIIEVAGAPIQSGDDADRSSDHAGYLLGFRYWDKAHLASLSEYLGAEIEMIHMDGISSMAANGAGQSADAKQYRTWRDFSGRPVAAFRITHPIPGIEEAKSIISWHSSSVFAVLLLFCVLFVVIILFTVIVPLKRLSHALGSENEDELSAVNFQGREWDDLAQLILQSIRQRKELIGEIAQRREAEEALVESEMKLRASISEQERIARDLHDGVIQSVYATGLQLEAAKMDLKQDAEKAFTKLNSAKDSLNVIIDDIRGFITGLAPQDLFEIGFQGGVERMLEPLRVSGIQVESKIDDRALGMLKDEERLNLFFVLQELLSNVVRHSGAKMVKVYLAFNADAVELIVDDNGNWCGKTPLYGEGNGLKNMRKRADTISATFSIELDEPGWTRALFRIPKSNDSLV